jgi:hypothetical protein
MMSESSRCSQSSSSVRDTVRCARCSRSWTAQTWRALPKERTLTHADVAAYVSDWPQRVTVEVRACSGCGHPSARRAEVV